MSRCIAARSSSDREGASQNDFLNRLTREATGLEFLRIDRDLVFKVSKEGDPDVSFIVSPFKLRDSYARESPEGP